MLNWLKSLWTKYKVHISVVGGALVIATVYGQCTVEPNIEAIEEAVEEAVEEEATDGAAITPSEISGVVPVVYSAEGAVSSEIRTIPPAATEDVNTENVEGMSKENSTESQ